MTKESKGLELHMLGGTKITGEHVATLYKRLTGRDVSPDFVQQAQEKLDARYAELEGNSGSESDAS